MPETIELIALKKMLEPQRRFSGLARLYGVSGAQQIVESHIVVIGIGGVGSWAVETLARSGVGRLTLIDLDHVSESNINRQIHAVNASLGQAKVLAMRDRIHTYNPACEVRCVEEFVDETNWPDILPLGVNAVIDACDQVRAKTAIAAWSLKQQAHFISVGAAGGKKLAHLVDIADLANCTHDPLLAQVRNRLRKEHGAPREGKKMGITTVYSREAVKPPDASCAIEGDGSLNCYGYGSVVAVTATFGQCAAGWVLDQISSDRAKAPVN